VTRVLLAKIPPQDGKMSYLYDAHVFHYEVQDGITYLSMSTSSPPDDLEVGGGGTSGQGQGQGQVSHRLTFSFLSSVRESFVEKFGSQGNTAIAFSMNEEFSPVLRSLMSRYNDPSEATSLDNISRVQGQIDDVKGVMVKNIEAVLERGEKIELLVDKTDRLNQQAFRFESQSRKLRNTMWWKKVKCYLTIGAVAAVVLFGLVSMACGGLDFHGCKSDHDDGDNGNGKVRRALHLVETAAQVKSMWNVIIDSVRLNK